MRSDFLRNGGSGIIGIYESFSIGKAFFEYISLVQQPVCPASFSGCPAWPFTQLNVTLSFQEAAALPGSTFSAAFVGLYQQSSSYKFFCNAVYNISAVGGEYHLTGFFQSLQSGNDSQELHAVIGSVCIAAGKLLFGLSIAEHNTVSAGAGVAAAGAVSKNLNSLDKIHSFIR